MRLLTATFTIVFGFGLYAQAEVKVHEPGQSSQAVLETEKVLDERITELNAKLKKHTVLFRQKIKALPAKTVLNKGKAENGECVYEKDGKQVDQLAADNDCIKIEVFDFQDSEWGKSELNYGSRAKYMVIFFAGGSSGTGDPMKEPEREVTKVIFNSINKDFKHNQVDYVNIEDGAPASKNDGAQNDVGGAHDEKIEIYYKNGFPTLLVDLKNEVENVSEKGVGKYALKNVENTKTNPIRTTLKKSFFVKNVDYFHKLFTNVADTNERYSLKKYKESNEYLKGTLKY